MEAAQELETPDVADDAAVVVEEAAAARDDEEGEEEEEEDEIDDQLSEESSLEADSPVRLRDTQEAAMEAFAELSRDELQEMARRLTKCNEGFQEMLREALDEQEQLRQETGELNEFISKAMQEVHRREQLRAKSAEAAVQEVRQQAGQKLGKLHRGLLKRASGLLDKGQDLLNNAKASGLVDRGQDFIANAKARHAEVVAAQLASQRRSGTRRAAARRRPKASPQRPEPQAPQQQEQAVSSAEAGAAGLAAAWAEQSPLANGKVHSGPARASDVVLKKRPVLSTDSTVVIEATIMLPGGNTEVLLVRMTDSCERACRCFLEEHKQRKWFEEPLIAWLKQAEAEATKLPLAVEGDLPEIRKQHAKAAQMPKSA